MKRVLHVVSNMHRGGAETMIMNLYRNIDRNKLQFDFVCHSKEKAAYEDEILSLGGRIFKINSLGSSGFRSYAKELREVIQNHGPFQAVHAHTDIQAGIVTLIAKQAKVNIRVCHSHNTKWKENPNTKDNIQSYLLRNLSKVTSNRYCACGEEAAKFFFGESNLNKGKVKIINNGINVDDFINVPKTIVDETKKELNIEKNVLTLGHIGRFYEQKNHRFLIRIAKELKNKGIKFKMILVGDGPLKKEIEDQVVKDGLENNIHFLGIREDIPVMMKIFDILVFPSFYEGLPVTLIEAQAAGLPILMSDTITKNVNLGFSNISYRKLDEDIQIWIDEIFRLRNNKNLDKQRIREIIKSKGYDAKINAKNIQQIYCREK